MSNYHLPHKVKLARVFVPTVKLIEEIVKIQKKKDHRRSACYVIGDAVQYYYDNYVAVKKMEKL